MKRQIIICVVLLFFLILFILIFSNIKKKNNTPEIEKKTEQIKTEMHTEEVTEFSKETEYKYCIVEEEGRLTVYEIKYHTIFIETAIKAGFLPDEIRQDLVDGIYFKSDKDMYDFLESYSS